MSPILIHIHVFYPELWDELAECLRSLAGFPYECVVTVPQNRGDLLSLFEGNKNISKIIQVENRGYDIAPFLQIIQGVNLGKYSYVIKLHTKRDMPGDVYFKPNPYNYGGSRWRQYLLNCCREEHLKEIIRKLEMTPALGMVADYRLIWPYEERRFMEKLRETLHEAGLAYKGYKYVLGSMFICRACLLEPLQRLNLTAADFSAPDTAHSENLAHVLERFMGVSVIAQGAEIADVFTSSRTQGKLAWMLRRIWSFLYYRKRGADGGLILKICKIPVYRRRGNR